METKHRLIPVDSLDSNMVVLRTQGQEYSHKTVDMWEDGKERVYTGPVPEGMVYVSINQDSESLSVS